MDGKIHVTRQGISNLSLDIHIGDNFLNSSNEIKLLGMVLDNCLSYDEQISYICKKVAPKLGILYRLGKFLSADILNIIYFTIVQPHFDYCISVGDNCPIIHLHKLQKLQNRGARIICKEFDRNISSTVLNSRLGWMNIETRRDFFRWYFDVQNYTGSGIKLLIIRVNLYQSIS